ncbi:psbF, partial [Symbiodinium microadriaticum]
MALRVLSFLMTVSAAFAFVPPAQSNARVQAPRSVAAQAPESTIEATPFASLMVGAGVGYAAAAVGAAGRKGLTSRAAEGDAPAVARTPVAYPIFTFRWLAIHALV